MTISNNINWQIESIRVTAFINDSLNPNMLETWLEEVSENLPSQINKSPTSFVGISMSTKGFLRTEWHAGRLDVTISPEEPQSNQAIASISEIASLFSRLVDRVPEIGELPLIDRVALGLVLFVQVPSDSEGLRTLSSSIVSLNLHDSAIDFLYRVNHPCESHFYPGLKINRLATWSVGKMRLIRHQINTDGTQDHQIISEAPLAIRLELDINTNEALKLEAPVEKLGKILDELKGIAVDIVSDGEAAMLN